MFLDFRARKFQNFNQSRSPSGRSFPYNRPPITRHNFLAGQRIHRGQRGNALDNAGIMQAAGKSDRENRIAAIKARSKKGARCASGREKKNVKSRSRSALSPRSERSPLLTFPFSLLVIRGTSDWRNGS